LTVQLIRNNRIRITGVAILFEGVSEETNDEDGRFEFSFIVRPGRTANRHFRLRNTDEGGDYADISFTCSNTRLHVIDL
jgi:TATA-binding protein-associated factor Taf7